MRGPIHNGLLGAVVSAVALAAGVPAIGAPAASTPTAGTPAAGASASGTPTAGKPAAKAGLQGTSWSSIGHLPDWSGVWELDWQSGRSPLGSRPPLDGPKLTPEYAAMAEKYHAAQKAGEHEQTDTANCVPPGMPQIMTQPYPVEFLFTPGKVTVAIEAYSQMRRIYVDGRPHMEDPDPTYQGDSIGHWEGDTLVVDSIGFIPNSYIAPATNHSDQMRIEERIRRTSPDTMEIRTTIYDTKALLQPWAVTRFYKRHTDWDLKEYICTQNNRDSADPEGRADINLKR
jgi:hypothetical protein